MSGPEIQANAIWTLMHGLPLRTAPAWLNLLAIFALSLIVPLLALRMRALFAALAVARRRRGLRRARAVRVRARARSSRSWRRSAVSLLATVATVVVSHCSRRSAASTSASSTGCSRRRSASARSELRATELEVIQRLGQAVDSRDEETGDHIGRMSELCHRLALAAGMDPSEAEILRHASAMHDVGKIAIPDAILRKPGPLTDDEWESCSPHHDRRRPARRSRSPLVQMGEVIARTHHERWDGSGYPAGLAGEDIPLVGRICAVADVFDALTSPRPYKHAWTVDDALDEIAAQSGRHFDPRLAALLLAMGADLRREHRGAPAALAA